MHPERKLDFHHHFFPQEEADVRIHHDFRNFNVYSGLSKWQLYGCAMEGILRNIHLLSALSYTSTSGSRIAHWNLMLLSYIKSLSIKLLGSSPLNFQL